MNQLKLTLEENIIDYIKKGLTELVNEKHETILKHAVINIYQAIELSLKQKLVMIDAESIYTNSKKNKTVDLNEAIKRLEIFGVYIDGSYKSSIYSIRDIRNDFTHHAGKHNVKTLSQLLSNCLEFLDLFLRNELNLELKEIAKKDQWLYLFDRIEGIKIHELQKANYKIMRLNKSQLTVANFHIKNISGECPRCLTDTMVIRNRMKPYPFWKGKCLICGLEAVLTNCQFCGKVIVDYGCSEVCFNCGEYFGMKGFEPNRTRASMDEINAWIDTQQEWYKANFKGKLKGLFQEIFEYTYVKIQLILKKDI